MTHSINMSDTISITGDTGSYTTWGTAGASPVYTISSGSSNWYNDTISISSDPNLTGRTLSVNGDADISGDLKVGGKSIVDSLERIEERLAILRPNDELEEKWENLRGLRKAYMELEKEILEKEKMWDILKK